jgi:hypothetical protein
MEISSQLKGGIYEVSFRYNTNLGAYATLMSDIPMLCAIGFVAFKNGRKIEKFLYTETQE